MAQKLRDIIPFAIFGFVVQFLFLLIIAATQDILKSTEIPSSTVLLCIAVPETLITLTSACFIGRLPYSVRIVLASVSYCAGLLLISLGPHVAVKLAGVCMESLARGTAHSTLVGMTAFYGEETVNVYACGTGTGAWVAPLIYTGMTVWGHVSSRTTLLVTLVLPPVLLVTYATMEHKHPGISDSMTTSREHLPYERLDKSHALNGDLNSRLNFKEHLVAVWETLPHAYWVFVGISTKYLLLQSVVTTLAFPHSSFKPRDHYKIYILAAAIGDFIGKTYGIVLLFIKPDMVVNTKHTWIFSVLNVAILFLCLFLSIYRFLSNIWFVAAVQVVSGFLTGALFVNATVMVGAVASRTRSKEFRRSFIIGIFAVGNLTGGIFGVYLEPQLKKHCETVLKLGKYCITRDT